MITSSITGTLPGRDYNEKHKLLENRGNYVGIKRLVS